MIETVHIQRLVRGINIERLLCLFAGASHKLGMQKEDTFEWEAKRPRRCIVQILLTCRRLDLH